jgi:formylglycine-generating enzyme required for sulfatase activity
MKEIILKIQAETKDTGKQEEKKKEEQKKAVEKVLDPVNLVKRKMIFHDIKPGKFMMGGAFGSSYVATEITRPFAMMQTPVTQMMWSILKVAMGEKDPNKINPSHFKTGADSITVNIKGIDVQMQPDHPVEKVSYEDGQEFLVGLNKLSNSDDPKDQALLKKLIPGHKKGDVYDFPTDAQWDFTMRDRGNANKNYFDRDDDADLLMYGWFSGNSGNETHAVATRQPRMIDRKPFFDMEGNVWEWVKDFWDGSTLPGGKDPLVTKGSFRVIRGGCYSCIGLHSGSGFRSSLLPDEREKDVGFRLVRIRP